MRIMKNRRTAARHLPKEALVIEGDVTDIASLETLFADIPENTTAYCIHCAAMVSVRNLVAEKIWHVNVDGTQYIVDQCREHGVRLIFIGSTGAIPEQPMGTAIKEIDHYDPNAVIGLYNPRSMAQSIAEEIDWMIEEGIVTIPAISAHAAA